MNVREADAGDTDGIARLVLKCCSQREAWDRARYELTREVIREYRIWFGRTAEDPRNLLLVAEDDDLIVGFLIGVVRKEMPIYKRTEYAWVQEMWVEPEHRDGSIGRELVARAASLFRKMGISQLRAETATSDEALRKLLESCGFRPCTVGMVLEAPTPRPRRRKPAAPTGPAGPPGPPEPAEPAEPPGPAA